MAKKQKPERLKVMVSSTVYHIEGMLDDIYAFLNLDYEVWMSHKGSMPVYPNLTALESCLKAVEECDLFLSVITPQYGSGVLPGELSITHQELLKAIELEKPRWILAHDHVVFCRLLFEKFGCKNSQDRDKLLDTLGYFTDAKRRELTNSKKEVLDDFRVIDMYEDAIRHDISVYKYKDRKGNWVQKFRKPDDGLLFATAQFGRPADLQQILKEQFGDEQSVRQGIPGMPS